MRAHVRLCIQVFSQVLLIITNITSLQDVITQHFIQELFKCQTSITFCLFFYLSLCLYTYLTKCILLSLLLLLWYLSLFHLPGCLIDVSRRQCHCSMQEISFVPDYMHIPFTVLFDSDDKSDRYCAKVFQHSSLYCTFPFNDYICML